MRKSKKIILSGLLLSLYIILARFISFKSQILVISFSFIPIIISAILLGPKYTLAIAALGDFLGATLFPFGSYFIGFTIIEAFIGLLDGFEIESIVRTGLTGLTRGSADTKAWEITLSLWLMCFTLTYGESMLSVISDTYIFF